MPVLIYKDEFNRIVSLENNLGGDIERNIGQGYEFMISDASPGILTYDVVFNGNGHARVEVETEMEDIFEQ